MKKKVCYSFFICQKIIVLESSFFFTDKSYNLKSIVFIFNYIYLNNTEINLFLTFHLELSDVMILDYYQK